MIDIHNHIIPNIDDGSNSLALSRELLHSAYEEGITDVCITPHFIKTDSTCNLRKKELIQRYTDFRNACSDIPVNLYLGNELYIDYQLDELLEKDEICSMNGSRYVLIEFPFHQYREEYDEYLYNVSLNHEIIIAHPERYSYVRENNDFVDRWLKAGYTLQSNSTSLYSHEGKACIYHLIEKGKLSFMASDCHNSYRPLSLIDAYQHISRKFSKETAHLLMEENPKAVIQNKRIHPVPGVRKRLF